MKDNKVIIPNPCNQGWNTMTPNDNGRHCASCNKTVVDFTTMTLEQIQTYFDKHNDTKVCGHFKVTQVETNRPAFHRQLIRIYGLIEQRVSVHFCRVMSLSVLSFCMTIVGCQNTAEGEKMPGPNCTNSEQHLTGDTIHIKQDSSSTLDGEVKVSDRSKKK